MYVLEVIPFARSGLTGSLSYRSNARLAPGTLVTVPLRKQQVRGLVVQARSIAEAKAELKSATFMLRSSSVTTSGSLPHTIITAARAVAAYHATSLGAVLAATLAEALPGTLPHTWAKGEAFEEILLERPLDKRIEAYRKRIALDQLEKRATLLVVATLAEAAHYTQALEEFKPILLTGEVREEKRALALQAASESKGLVIATSAFSWIPLRYLGSIIIERAGANAWRAQKMPYLNRVEALTELARARECRLILGDYPLPLTLRAKPAHGLTEAPLGAAELYDARKKEEEPEQFSALPDVLKTRIGKALAAGGRVAVLAVRRGYAPAVVCRDCGTLIKDPTGRTMTLTTEKGERVFRSSDGVIKETSGVVCDLCGSWNLLPLGIGVERLEEELREAFPDAPQVRFDTDTIKTPSQGRKALKLARAPGTLLVGTEFMLPWLSSDEPLAYGVIASADSYLSLPFWRARERLLHLGLTLRTLSHHMVIATRRPDDAAIESIIDPVHGGFFAEETGLRKTLGYPPFSTLLTLTAEGSPFRLEEAFEGIRKAVREYPLIMLPDRILRSGRVRRVAVMRLPEGLWPDTDLSDALAALPPTIRVQVDPESLW